MWWAARRSKKSHLRIGKKKVISLDIPVPYAFSVPLLSCKGQAVNDRFADQSSNERLDPPGAHMLQGFACRRTGGHIAST